MAKVDLLVKNGEVWTPGGFLQADIAVTDGKVIALGKPPFLPDLADTEIDANGKKIIPGLIDTHTHHRDPGFTYKEDITTATMAAAAGGVTTSVGMPNVKWGKKAGEDALTIAERVKGRLLLEMLATRQLKGKTKEDEKVLKKDREFQEVLISLRKRIEVIAGSRAETPQKEINALINELVKKEKEYTTFMEEVKLTGSEFSSLLTGDPLPPPKIQSLLDPATSPLEYLTTRDATYAWLITKDEIRVYEIPINERELLNKVAAFLSLNITNKARKTVPVVIYAPQEVADEIARILGMESAQGVKLVARILWNGGNVEAVKKEGVEYLGPQSCAVKSIVAGGDKMCLYGCLGGSDCVDACQFGAIFMNENGLPVVVEELCTGCGQCVEACPRGVIEIHPEDRELFVFCKNQDDPKRSKEVCNVACFGCGICARKSDGSIVMKNFLPEINYESLDISKIPIDKCKTGAVKFVHPEKAAELLKQENIDVIVN